MSLPIDVSIIIVNWNTKKLLKDCIESVINETKDITFEIIVVDNNSNDGSPEMIEEDYRDRVTLIRNQENMGFAYANNQAMKIAKGSYLLLLNSDTVVLDRAIAKSFKFMADNKDIGLVGCRLLNADKSIQYSCYNFNSIRNAIYFKTGMVNNVNKDNRYKYENLIKSFDYNSVLDVDYVCGAYMMFSRQVFERIGFLDESFFMYAEEADFCDRVKKGGFRVVYFPGATIIHLGGGSSRKINILSEKRRIISRLRFIKKRKGTIYFASYRLFSGLTALKNVLQYSVKGDRERKELNREKLKAIIKLKYD